MKLTEEKLEQAVTEPYPCFSFCFVYVCRCESVANKISSKIQQILLALLNLKTIQPLSFPARQGMLVFQIVRSELEKTKI